MANKELMVTLGLDSSSYSQNVKRAKDLNKELDSSWKLLASSSDKFEKGIQGLGKKQEYLSEKIKVANGLSEVYSKRLAESEKALEDATKQSQHYGSEVERLSKIKESVVKHLGEESKMYKAVSEKLKANTQLYDKANKAIEVNNRRILEAKTGYNETQTSIQQLGREVTFTAEKMSAMRADANLKALKGDISELDHQFDLVKSSVSGFDNTMDGLQQTQEYYNQRTKQSKELLSSYNTEMKNSSEKIQSYEKDLRDVSQELETWQKLMESHDMNEEAEQYEEARQQVQSLRKEYSEINQILEFHKDRLESVSGEYKSTEKDIAKMAGSLDANAKKMQSMNDKITFEPISKQVKELTNVTLKKLEKEMEALDRDFDILTTSVNDYEKSLTGLNQKQTHYTKSLELAKKAFDSYNTEMKDAEKTVNSLTKEQKELETEIENQIKALKKLTGKEWDEQAKSIEKLKKKYEDVNKDLDLHQKRLNDVEKGYTSSRQNVAKLTTELGKTEKQLESFGKKKYFDTLDNSIKTASDKMKLLESQFKVTESAVEKFGRTQKDLADKTEFYKQKVGVLKEQMANYKETIYATEKETAKLKSEQEQATKTAEALRQKLKGMDADSPKYQETIIAITRLEAEIEDLNQDIRTNEQRHNELQTELNQTTAETNELINATNRLSNEFVSSKFTAFGDKMSKIGSGMQQVGQSFLGVTMAIGGTGTAMVKTGTDFTTSMSQVRAVTGATEEDFQALANTARELGKETVFTASESADALTYLGLAGYSAQESMDSLPHILSLAQAGAMDLANASDLATDSISSLGYVGTDAVKALPDYLDKVAMASTKSNTSIEQMMKAYVKAGGQFDNLNISLDTSASMLGVLANRGIKAEEAGTSLNSILINMTKASGESAEAMKELGVSAFDANGDIRNIEDVIVDLAQALQGLTEKEQVQLINMIGGKTQAKTIQKLMQGMIDDTGNLSAEYKELKAEIEQAPNMDALENMADTMTNNLGGDIKILGSTIQESFLAIFESIEPQLREIVQNITGFVKTLTDKFLGLSSETQMFILKFAGVLAILPPILMAFGSLVMGIGLVSSGFGKLSSILPSFGTKVEGATTKVSGFTKVLDFIKTKVPMVVGTIAKWGGKLVAVIKPVIATIGTIIGGLSLKMVLIGAVIAGALFLVYKGIKYLVDNWTELSAKMSEAWTKTCETVSGWVDKVKEKITNGFQAVMEWFRGIPERVSVFWEKIKTKTMEVIDSIVEWFKGLPAKFTAVMDSVKEAIGKGLRKVVDGVWGFLNTVAGFLGALVGNIIAGVVVFIKSIKDIFDGFVEYIKGWGTLIKGIFTGDFEAIKEGVKTIFSSIFTTIGTVLSNIWKFVTGALENIANVFGINLSGIFTAIETWASNTWNTFTTWVTNTWNSFLQWATNLIVNFPIWMENLKTSFFAWCEQTKQNIKQWGIDTYNNFIQWVNDTYNKFIQWKNDMIANLKTWAKEWLTNTINSFRDWVKGIKDGFTNAINNFITWKNDMKQQLIQWFTDWIANTKAKLSEWAKKFEEIIPTIINYFKGLPKQLFDIGKEMVSNLWDGFKSMLSSFGKNVSGAISNILNKFKSVDVEADVSYSEDGAPMASSIPFTAPFTYGRRSGFGDIGSMFEEMFREAITLDNFKTNGGFYSADSMKSKSTTTSSVDNSLVEALLQQNQLLMQLLTQSRPIEVGLAVDGRQIAKASARYMDAEISSINSKKSRLGGR